MAIPAVLRRLAGAAALAVPALAAAHPHVWIRFTAQLRMQGSTITAIDERWRFSEGFPVQLVGIDTLPDSGPLDARQTAMFRDQAFSSLSHAQYFTHLFVDGAVQRVGSPEHFRVSIDHGKLVYSFTLPFVKPVEVAAHQVSLGIWDDSFFVDYETDGANAVSLGGEPAPACTVKAFQDHDHPIFNGLYLPQAHAITC